MLSFDKTTRKGRNISLSIKNIVIFTLFFIVSVCAYSHTDGMSESSIADDCASDSVVISFLSKRGIAVTDNNKLEILKDGIEKFPDLFDCVRHAKHHIHLEYFNFRNDSIANSLFELLEEKVKEGIEVRILFDGFGNISNNKPLKKKHLKVLREKGLEVVVFDPVKFPYLNHVFHRDHRKIAVIDGKTGYTGGINVADYYIKGLPKIGPWHDTHLKIEGGAVKDLQDIFLSIWNKTTKQNIGGEAYYPQPETTSEYDKTVAIVDRWPGKTPKNMRLTYAEAIRAAEHKIQIVNPYFLPPRLIKKELKAAIDRGVRVEIMFSVKSDISLTPEGIFDVAYRLMKRGAHIYVYNEGFHHSKIMMVDDKFCTIGSTNLDSRSLRYDYEVNAFIFDEEITAELCDFFDSDKNKCTYMTREEWKKRSAWKRFVGKIANMLTPFL